MFGITSIVVQLLSLYTREGPGDSFNRRTFSSEIRQLDLRRCFVTRKVTHLNRALWWDCLASVGLA
jgi:hypothetical protein